MSPFDPSSWKRDQPRLGHFVVHRGRHVIGSEKGRHYVIDWAKKALTPFGGPCEEVTAVLDGAVLCEAEGTRFLQVDVDARYARHDLPSSIAHPETPVVGDAHDGTVVLLEAERMHLWSDGSWTSHDIGHAPKTPGTMGVPSHVLLTESRVYAGYDRGEWGGGLFTLDLKAPKWTAVGEVEGEEIEIGVQKLTRKDAVWALFGLAHLGLREGFLVRHGDGLQVVAQNDAPPFPLDDADFASMAFDEKGALYLLSGGRGLLRRKDDGWKHLTPQWSSFAYVNDLAVRRGVAALAMYDAGVVFLDLSTRTATRRTLP